MSIIDILNVVKRWLWLIILIVGITFATQLYLSTLSRNKFEATAVIQVLTPDREDVSVSEAYLFTSDRDEITVAINNFLKISGNREIYDQTDIQVENHGVYGVSTRAELGADLIYVTAEASDAGLAAEIANVFAQNAIKYYGSIRSQASNQAYLHFESQLESAENDLAQTKQLLIDFQETNGITTPSSEIQIVQASLQRLQEAKDQVAIEAILEGANNSSKQADEIKQANQLEIEAQSARVEILRIEADIDDLNTSDAGSRETRSLLEEEIELYEQKIDLVNQELSQLSSEVVEPADTLSEQKIDDLISTQKGKLNRLNELEAQYSVLVENVKRAQENTNFLASKADEAQLMEAFAKQATFLQQIEAAKPPTSGGSNSVVIYLVGALGAIGASLLIIFMLDYFTGGQSARSFLRTKKWRSLTNSEST